MTPPVATDGGSSLHETRVSLAEPWGKWPPLVFQIVVTVAAVGDYAFGNASVTEAGMALAWVCFGTAVFLSVGVRDRRSPGDLMAVFGYLTLAAGFGFVTAPSYLGEPSLTTPVRALGLACFGVLITGGWVLFIHYNANGGA